jgi:chemotaxis protein CheZ
MTLPLDDKARAEFLTHAREIVARLEAADDEGFMAALDTLARTRETDLFNELGKLTRSLHETLTGFQLDSRISALAEKDIPDAKERLNYVITMTEQAANRTMDAIEEMLPLAETLGERTEKYASAWKRFRGREMPVDEFRELSRELDGFFEQASTDIQQLRGSLSDVLMAQDYQDLTGQIIRRVITMVQEVEEQLVELIRMAGKRLAPESTEEDAQLKEEDDNRRGVGPAVPGVDKGNLVSSQDEVDDLLSSLGF